MSSHPLNSRSPALGNIFWGFLTDSSALLMFLPWHIKHNLWHHVYTVFKLNINCLVNKVWAPESLVCDCHIFVLSEPDRGGSSLLVKWVGNLEIEGLSLTKVCFHSEILSFVKMYYVYLSVEVFFVHKWPSNSSSWIDVNNNRC